MTDLELAEEIEREGVERVVYGKGHSELIELNQQITAALRRADLAQTEIKGHMKVEDELKEQLALAQRAINGALQVANESQARIAELEKDAVRLDYLEREMELEQKYLRDFSREDRPLALFRRNVPITRAAIDAALKSRA